MSELHQTSQINQTIESKATLSQFFKKCWPKPQALNANAPSPWAPPSPEAKAENPKYRTKSIQKSHTAKVWGNHEKPYRI